MKPLMHTTRSPLPTILAATLLALQGGGLASAEPAKPAALTWPYASEAVSPVEQLAVISPTTGYACPVIVRRPPGPGPFPLVVVLHGGTVPHDAQWLRKNAMTQHNVVRLLAAGYAIALPSFSSRKEDPQTTAALRDCQAVLDHVRHLPGIDPESLFVFGGSGGGSLALELAGEAKLAAVAAGEPANVLFTGVWTKDNIPQLDAIMFDPLKFCDNDKVRSFTRAKIDRIACPVLIVHSDVHSINKINDVFVIPLMKEAGKAPEVCYIPGARHGFYFASRETPVATLKAFEAIETFFRRYTHTPPKPIEAASLELRSTTPGEAGADALSPVPRAGSTRAGKASSTDKSDIDWNRVRTLRRRVLAGETLSPEDQSYYEKGKAAWPPRQ